ncbi:protein disulfide isomerase-like 1-6 [Quercus suber]|uniref:Protein disulfide isomerase-like 1-6 n=1 Tax=Quercus suber TaxID=58331 RepID=A0AAW0KJW8_QUESU
MILALSEELIALDEEEERQEQEEGSHSVRSSEAEVLTKAQRIVLELNNDNTKRAIDGNEFVLILGYAPWCARSAELMPQFAEAATSLKELGSPLLMAKLDADRHTKAASTLGIKGFPTLLLFVNGTSQAYTGGLSAEEIVIWARKKTGVPLIRISSVAEADEFLKKYHTFVIGLFEKFEVIVFAEVDEFKNLLEPLQEVARKFKSKMMFLYVDITDENLAKPFLTLFGLEEAKNTVVSFPISKLKFTAIFFAEVDEFKNLLEPLQEVARKFKSKMMFLYVDITDENLAKPFLTLFGLEEAKNTVVTAFDNKISSKFLLQSDLTPINIEEFCTRLLDGTLSPYFKSQPIPDNIEASIQIIVGKTFDDLVLSSPKNVLLEVKKIKKISSQNSETIGLLKERWFGVLGMYYQENAHYDHIFHISTSINITVLRCQEQSHLWNKKKTIPSVDEYPALFLYPANDKANPIKLSTKSGLKELAASINKHLKANDHVKKDEL